MNMKWGVELSTYPTVEMARHHIDKGLKRFLKHIFCVVGRNSPYTTADFVQVLLDAVEHTDFTNNTCIRVGGPTGETVFSRLRDTNVEKIKQAFLDILLRVFPLLKRMLRNRMVGLAFDITEDSYYGKVEGVWIHPHCEARGSTGCFKFITVSCTGSHRFILGSLPVRIGADIVALVMELIKLAQKFVVIEIALFDRGFVDLRLVESLHSAGIHYQILWRKSTWTKKKFKKMKRGEVGEVIRTGTYSHRKSKYRVKARFVLLKKYMRYKKGKAYDWVFATNTRQKSQHCYIDKYCKRWSIETVFRVLDNIQIKTTTKNEIIRYFLTMFCCLIYNLWKCATMLELPTSLKNFVVALIHIILRPAKVHFMVPDG